MVRFARSLSRRQVALAIAVGGLATSGLWLARGHTAVAVQAQEARPAPGDQVDPTRRKVSAKPAGVVVAIADDRASFTFRTASGEEQTVRVTEWTVLSGRSDRPYNMGLLQVGDGVRVKVGGLKQQDPARPPNRAGAARKLNAAPAETPVARRVIVRPAAEGPFREGGKLGEGAQQSGGPGTGDQEGGLHGGASE